MKTYFQKIILLTLVSIFTFGGLSISQKSFASVVNPEEPCQYGPVLGGGTAVINAPCNGTRDNKVIKGDVNNPGYIEQIFQNTFASIALVILKFAALLTGLGGIMLNGAIFHTVVNVSQNYASITSINDAWKVIRDVSNMAFIFVLLYAAIQTILGIGKDTQRLIVRVVAVAILINFSLFFTKVVIDISNVLALTFYDAMVPNAAVQGLTNVNVSVTSVGGVPVPTLTSGLSDAFMNALNLQNLYDLGKGQTLDWGGLIGTGVMGTILLLIAAFVFFAIALMFIIRYVILIIVLILSPIAFIAYILPQAEKLRNKWSEALFGQAFFAPIYMILTWVTLKVLSGITSSHVFGTSGSLSNIGNVGATIASNANNAQGLFATIINYVVVIIFLIASLILAKESAGRAGPEVGNLTKWAMGAAGGTTIGMAGRLGRNTIGAGADRLAQSEGLQRWAGRSFMGQQVFKGVNRTAESSFDFRATRAGNATVGALGAGEAQKGGQRATIQAKTAAREKFAQSLRAPGRAGLGGAPATPSAKESYATRISGGPITHGGTQDSANTIFGTLGRSNRVAASKILNGQLAPLETQEQTLIGRENQLNQQLTNLNNEQTTLNALNGGTGPTGGTPQAARLAVLNGPITSRNSIAYVQDQLTNTQTNLTRVTAEVTRIRGIITANQLNNPGNPIINPATGVARPARSDEQNY